MPGTKELLKAIGIPKVENLFLDIPEEARRALHLVGGLSETELLALFQLKASENMPSIRKASFLGGDVNPRYTPAPLRYILSRGEFLTAYTSYQPEISQGMLQALFEYQSLMVELTGMDVVNASLYDAATGLGEALRLATRINRKKEFLLPDTMCYSKKNVAHTYIEGYQGKIAFYKINKETGKIDVDNLLSKITPETSAVYAETPNSWGVIDDSLFSLKKNIGNALLIAGVEPISLSLLRDPGDYETDIVIGEGQGLGLPMGFGGPTLGILGVRKEYVRKMPGRLVGATHDTAGKRAFCITLQTREQHIRREKATSNICSNEALCALGAGAYIALLGETGLRRLATLLLEKAHDLAGEINNIEGYTAPFFKAPFFNTFSIKTPVEYSRIRDHLLQHDIHGGAPLEIELAEKDSLSLFSVNENISNDTYPRLIKLLHEIKGWGC